MALGLLFNSFVLFWPLALPSSTFELPLDCATARRRMSRTGPSQGANDEDEDDDDDDDDAPYASMLGSGS